MIPFQDCECVDRAFSNWAGHLGILIDRLWGWSCLTVDVWLTHLEEGLSWCTPAVREVMGSIPIRRPRHFFVSRVRHVQQFTFHFFFLIFCKFNVSNHTFPKCLRTSCVSFLCVSNFSKSKGRTRISWSFLNKESWEMAMAEKKKIYIYIYSIIIYLFMCPN